MWGVLGCPKIKIIGSGAQGHVQNSRNHRNKGLEGSPISKSESYKFKLKQNNTMELLNISFAQIYHKDGPKIVQHEKCFFMFLGSPIIYEGVQQVSMILKSSPTLLWKLFCVGFSMGNPEKPGRTRIVHLFGDLGAISMVFFGKIYA